MCGRKKDFGFLVILLLAFLSIVILFIACPNHSSQALGQEQQEHKEEAVPYFPGGNPPPVNKYNVTVQNDGNGTASASPNPAAEGEVVTIQATPNAGFKFREWQVILGGVALSNTAAAHATFTMPANAVTVKAGFDALPPGTPSLIIQNITFPGAAYGYAAAPAAINVTITNKSLDQAADVASILLDGPNAASFLLGGEGAITTVAPNNGTAVFSIQPKTGREAKNHIAAITVRYGGGVVAPGSEIATADVSFEVTKASGASLASPTEASKTSNSITVNAVTAPGNGQTVEYAISTASNGTGLSLWQDTLVFSGLSDGTYYVYARSRENDNYLAGAYSVSTGITVNALSEPKVIGVAAGNDPLGLNHTVALMSDGRLWAWGANNKGQLGNNWIQTHSMVPDKVVQTGSGVSGVPFLDAIAISAGEAHTVALKSNGSVWAWGKNNYGQLGNGAISITGSQLIPLPVYFFLDVIEIAAGFNHTVALISDGSVWTWGFNDYGQLGNGTFASSNLPVAVLASTSAVSIAAGGNHTVARLSDGTILSWGDNSSGQLGDGTNTNRNTPVSAAGITGAVSVAAGANHTVVRLGDGTVQSWGDNSSGQLGDGTNDNRNTPVTVSGLTGVVSVAAGGNHTIARLGDGTLKAWGANSSGQLGDRTVTSRSVPVSVYNSSSGMDLFSDCVAMAAGGVFSIAVKSDGSVWTWGANSQGQLGDGTTAGKSYPVLVVFP